MKPVTFTQPTRVGTLYNTGETAGFEDDVAEALIKQGFAVAGAVKLDTPEPPQRFQGEAPGVARPVEFRPDPAPVQTVQAQVPPAAVVRDPGGVRIPETWATMSAAEMRALAEQLGVVTANKAEAQAAIEAEMQRRQAAA